ncbi:hypothetical protein E3N88_23015 [Mikania micrantha]|uniref:Uncharacterized protein n=1 Tax=Mikania micrantha TaxID=192012 RepID=A0A5N6NCB5_9ASTR|nr:hypothetical protein E3N88_23015 [Mikania micrantha]
MTTPSSKPHTVSLCLEIRCCALQVLNRPIPLVLNSIRPRVVDDDNIMEMTMVVKRAEFGVDDGVMEAKDR